MNTIERKKTEYSGSKSVNWFMSLLVTMILVWGVSNGGPVFAQMNMPGTGSENVHDHGSMHSGTEAMQHVAYKVPDTFKKQLGDVYQAYFHIQFALSHDNAAEAKSGAEHLGHALNGVDMKLLDGDAHMAWMKEYETIKKTGAEIAGSDNMHTARSAFIPLSQAMINVTRTFGTSGKGGLYQFHCPMASGNEGADWLQNKSDLENPFYGSSMFKCGELVETYEETQ